MALALLVMNTSELMADAFDRVRGVVRRVLQGLTPEQLSHRLDDEANTIAWLVWHLTRVQDDHVAGVAGTDQVWTSDGWVDRFGLPFKPRDTGYGHSPEQVAAVRVGTELLMGYYDAVHERTLRFIDGLDDGDLDRVVDENYDPPVTLGVRLVSVINDDLQHAGQAAFVKGLLPKDLGRRQAPT
jgi:uncharacterized damage-inducible protein DinB